MLKQLQRNRSGQSTAEYAIVIALVLGAVIGMQTYVRRGLQGRTADAANTNLPNATSAASGIGANPGTDPAFPATFGKFDRTQFEPYYASSTSDSTTLVDSLAPGAAANAAAGKVHVGLAGGGVAPAGTISAVQGGFRTQSDRNSDSAESAPVN